MCSIFSQHYMLKIDFFSHFFLQCQVTLRERPFDFYGGGGGGGGGGRKMFSGLDIFFVCDSIICK